MQCKYISIPNFKLTLYTLKHLSFHFHGSQLDCPQAGPDKGGLALKIQGQGAAQVLGAPGA